MDDKAIEAAGPVVIPILQEVAHVTTRVVDRGGASVQITVLDHDEAVGRDLVQDVVSVERVKVGRVVETAPQVRQDGDVTIIPVLEEQLVVTKRLVLTEEIHVRRGTRTVPWNGTITLRREIATVKPIAESGA